LIISAREVVVIGYSFRDDHVNAYMRDYLLANDRNRMTVVSPQATSMKHGCVGLLKDERGDQIESLDMSAGSWFTREIHNQLLRTRSSTFPLEGCHSKEW
jgi:hypothetical protein